MTQRRHDKCVKTLAVAPHPRWPSLRFNFVRALFVRDLTIEKIAGPDHRPPEKTQTDENDRFLFINQGHLTLLLPPSAEAGERLVERHDAKYGAPVDLVALGRRALLDAEAHSPSRDLIDCPDYSSSARCKEEKASSPSGKVGASSRRRSSGVTPSRRGPFLSLMAMTTSLRGARVSVLFQTLGAGSQAVSQALTQHGGFVGPYYNSSSPDVWVRESITGMADRWHLHPADYS